MLLCAWSCLLELWGSEFPAMVSVLLVAPKLTLLDVSVVIVLLSLHAARGGIR